MALTDEVLQDIMARLTPEERKQLLAQLGHQVEIDDITNPTGATGSQTKPKVKPKTDGSKVYCCIACGSVSYKKHGKTNTGMQRYRCNDCGKTFSENYGDSLRYTHLSEWQWRTIIQGIVYDLSLPKIAEEAGVSASTVWLCRTKVNQAIATMYGYNDLFQGATQADEYYCRASFKGKRDPDFFIMTLDRMPRHHYTYDEMVEWLKKNNLYTYVRDKYPDDESFKAFLYKKAKRGISNEQICVLTLVDQTGRLYLEPVSVGRLEKAMAKTKLKPRFTPDKSNVMVTDDHNAYNRVLYGTQTRHEVVKADRHRKSKYNLAKVNSVHNQLREYMEKYHGRAFTTKYLDLNLMLFWWMFKYRDYTTAEKVDALYSIMNDQIPDIDLRESVNQVTSNELKEREITIDTKGVFPKKL